MDNRNNKDIIQYNRNIYIYIHIYDMFISLSLSLSLYIYIHRRFIPGIVLPAPPERDMFECVPFIILDLYNFQSRFVCLVNAFICYELLVVHGQWLMARGSYLKAHGSLGAPRPFFQGMSNDP